MLGLTVSAVALTLLVLVPGSGNAQDRSASKLNPLDIKFEKPRTVTIYPGNDAETNQSGIPRSGRVYWYFPFTLTNKGDKPEKFFVSVRAKSDKNRKYTDLALPDVEKKIERIERRKLHSKVDLLAAGKNLADYQEYGPGETRQCVAIFNPLDSEADTITIDFHGMINDIALENLGDGRFRVTERVLRIVFHRPGDEFYTSLDQFKLKSKSWITLTSETGKRGE